MYQWNLDRGYDKHGKPDPGTRNIERLLLINSLARAGGIPAPYPGVSAGLGIDTGEKFGFQANIFSDNDTEIENHLDSDSSSGPTILPKSGRSFVGAAMIAGGTLAKVGKADLKGENTVDTRMYCRTTRIEAVRELHKDLADARDALVKHGENSEAVDAQQYSAAVLLWRMATPHLRNIFRDNQTVPAELFMAWRERMVVDDNNTAVIRDADQLLKVRDAVLLLLLPLLLLTRSLSQVALARHFKSTVVLTTTDDNGEIDVERINEPEGEHLPLMFLDRGMDGQYSVADPSVFDPLDVPAFVGKPLNSYAYLAREMGLSNPPTPFVMPGDREAAKGADERKLMAELMQKYNFDPDSTAEARSFETLLSIWTERVHTEAANKLQGQPSLDLRMYVHPRRAPAAPLSNTPSHISLSL